MRTVVAVPVWVIVCFAVGLLASYLQNEALMMWYPLLWRSPLTPPNIVFPIVWSILYLLMGISAGIILNARTSYSWVLISLFFIQLGINLLWSFCFFNMQSPVLGFAVLVALFMFVLVYVVGSYMQSKVAAYLNIPYLLWLLFALYLNGYTAIYN